MSGAGQPAIRVQIRDPQGGKHVLSIDPSISLGDFKRLINSKLPTPLRRMELCVGYPPVEITERNESTPISKLTPRPVKGGDVLVAQEAGVRTQIFAHRLHSSDLLCDVSARAHFPTRPHNPHPHISLL